MDCCGGPTFDNDYIQALFSELLSIPFAPGGKIIDLGSTGALGTSTRLLTQTRVRRVAAQAVASGASYVDISWDTEDTDPLNLITVNATTGTTFTVPAGGDGYYSIDMSGTLSGTPTATQAHIVRVFVTAAATGISRSYRQSAFLTADQHIHIGPLPLAAGDTFVIGVSQVTGGSLNETAGLCIVTWEGTV